MAINQEDLAKVRELVLETDPEVFKKDIEDSTKIFVLNPELGDKGRIFFFNSLYIPEEYKAEFKYPSYISYKSTLYGVLHNEFGYIVKQIKKSYGELMWEKIICKNDKNTYPFYKKMFIPDNSTYHLDWYKVSEGYNLDDLPSSCMKGKGDLFIPLDNLAEMAVLVKDSTNQMVARCIVWNAGIVEKADGTKIEKDLYDRLYYVDGEAEKAMVKYLENKGIKSVSNYWCETFNIRIKNPFNNGLHPWMDTFCILRENDYLYFYDWQEYGYSQQDITDLARDYPTLEIIGALLSQDGDVVYPQEDFDDYDENYSDYEERCIPTSRQVYSDYMGDILTDTEAFISSYDGDWYPINGKGDVWLPVYPNPENKTDYVVGVNAPQFWKWTDPITREQYLIHRSDILVDDVTGIRIPKDRAIYIRSRNVYVSKDHKLEDVLDYFAKDNQGHLDDIELEVLKTLLKGGK